jgi:DNA-binding transcriptional LysR family regulator
MIDLVSIFQALLVREHLSLTRAAAILGVSQSAVSRRLRSLEDTLGVSLFERGVYGVRLTDAGRRFLDKAQLGLTEIDEAVRAAGAAGRGADGAIRIGILSSISAGPVRDLLSAYCEVYSDVALSVADGAATAHIAALTERRLDIAFLTGAPPASQCDALVIWSAQIFVAIPDHHLLAKTPSLDWPALRGEHFIITRDAPGPEIHDHIVRRAAAFGHSPSVEPCNVRRETLMHLVGLGFGISLISESGTATRYPNVVFRPLISPEDVLPYSAVWLPQNDNPALRRLLSLARAMAEGRPLPPPG